MALLSTHRLGQIQAVSGLAFGSFLSLHLLNTFTAIVSQDALDNAQLMLREYYQTPLIEAAVVGGAGLIHIASSVMIGRKREALAPTTVAKRDDWRLEVHRTTGYVLAICGTMHAIQMRLPAVLYDVKADFSGVAFTLDRWPLLAYPLYTSLGVCGVYHFLYGVRSVLRRLWTGNGKIRVGRRFDAIVSIGCAGIVLAVGSFGGFFFPVRTLRYIEFYNMYRRILPLGWV